MRNGSATVFFGHFTLDIGHFRPWSLRLVKDGIMERVDPITRCSGCQAEFVCRIQAGYSSCWCFELPHVCPVDADLDAGCLCPTCLQARVTAQLAARKSATTSTPTADTNTVNQT